MSSFKLVSLIFPHNHYLMTSFSFKCLSQEALTEQIAEKWEKVACHLRYLFLCCLPESWNWTLYVLNFSSLIFCILFLLAGGTRLANRLQAETREVENHPAAIATRNLLKSRGGEEDGRRTLTFKNFGFVFRKMFFYPAFLCTSPLILKISLAKKHTISVY